MFYIGSVELSMVQLMKENQDIIIYLHRVFEIKNIVNIMGHSVFEIMEYVHVLFDTDDLG